MSRPLATIAIALLSAFVLALGCGGEDSDDQAASTVSASLQEEIDQAEPELGDPKDVPKGTPAAAFGKEAPEADRKSAAKVLAAYLEAVSADRFDEACALLAPPLADRFAQLAEAGQGEGGGEGGCPAIMERVSGAPSGGERFGFTRLLSLRADGDRALAVYAAPEHATYSLAMSREDSDWRIATIAPVPIG